jgi:cysteine-rich repeat protein
MSWNGAAVSVLSLLAMSECSFDSGRGGVDNAGNGESSEVAEVLSPNPCTPVIMTSPPQNFTATVGVPILLSGSATCPVGQTPEYQYWVKPFSSSSWTILGPYVPGSSMWTPPSDNHWCVTVVARAIGAPESYQVRTSARCTAPRCGNGVVGAGEQCDDGNTVNGDACDDNCTTPRCGNGIVGAGEQCDDGNTVNCDACDDNCTTPRCGNGIVDPGEQCDDGNSVNGDPCNNSCVLTGLRYIKASNTGTDDTFGWSIAISADGSTLAVGAAGESSAATVVNGNQADNSMTRAGAVYVFTRSGTNSALNAGAVYEFTRTGSMWSQQAYVKASNTEGRDVFGYSVALSPGGTTLLSSAIFEASAATGVDGNQADNAAPGAGAVYVLP